jgi:hypothetical protein
MDVYERADQRVHRGALAALCAASGAVGALLHLLTARRPSPARRWFSW